MNRMNGSYPVCSRRAPQVVAPPCLPPPAAPRRQEWVPHLQAWTSALNPVHPLPFIFHRCWTLLLMPPPPPQPAAPPHSTTVRAAPTTAPPPKGSTCPVSPQSLQLLPTTSTMQPSTLFLRRRRHLSLLTLSLGFIGTLVSLPSPAWGHCRITFNCLSFSPRRSSRYTAAVLMTWPPSGTGQCRRSRGWLTVVPAWGWDIPSLIACGAIDIWVDL